MLRGMSNDDYMRAFFGISVAFDYCEEMLEDLQQFGDPRALEVTAEIKRRRSALDPAAHPSGFKLLKGGKE